MPEDLPKKLADLLDMFSFIEDRQERIETLIGVADRFKPVPERIAARPYPETARVPHCESEAFVFAEPRPDGTLDFHFAVENPQGISAMSMAVIIDETLSGEPLEKVVAVPVDVVYRIFGNELSMGKTMGLTGIVQMVHALAKQHLTKEPRASARAVAPGDGAPCDEESSGMKPASPIDRIQSQDLEARVVETLRTCYDPEIPVNIYDLGLIYNVSADASTGKVDIRMTLTSPACPVAGSLPPEVESKVLGVYGVTDANVEVVWDPPWTPDLMSEEAKLQLNL